jgi:hypothetical protein
MSTTLITKPIGVDSLNLTSFNFINIFMLRNYNWNYIV